MFNETKRVMMASSSLSLAKVEEGRPNFHFFFFFTPAHNVFLLILARSLTHWRSSNIYWNEWAVKWEKFLSFERKLGNWKLFHHLEAYSEKSEPPTWLSRKKNHLHRLWKNSKAILARLIRRNSIFFISSLTRHGEAAAANKIHENMRDYYTIINFTW